MRNRLDQIAARLPSPFPRDVRGAAMLATLLAVVANFASVFVAGILRGLTFALALTDWSRERPRTVPWNPAVVPGLCFLAWTALSALASPQPLHDLAILKKTYLLMWLIVVPYLFRAPGSLEPVFKGLFLASGATAAAGVLQFAADPDRDWLHRIAGLLSHYMTFSGILMIAFVVIIAYMVCNGWKKWWVVPLALLVGACLVLTETRNAWGGAIAGTFVVLALLKPRATPVIVGIVCLICLANPGKIQDRIKAGFDTSDSTTRGRLELLRTSVGMIRDNPVLGVGPKSVSTAALRYRTTSEFPDWLYQHMHNNALQIAAERGIPGLLLWLWFMFRLAWDAWRVYREARADDSRRDALFAGVSALGVWAAFVVAGVAEYNFGDSEVLSLFIFVAAIPYAFLPGKRP
jgi:O-antigen ligase